MKYRGKFHKGWKPIPDTYWKCETISKDGMSFEYLGVIEVSGKIVKREMDEHRSIKGYTPYNIAKQIAAERFPQANPVIVTQIWREEYVRKNGKHKKVASE